MPQVHPIYKYKGYFILTFFSVSDIDIDDEPLSLSSDEVDLPPLTPTKLTPLRERFQVFTIVSVVALS